jgi:hypothetical protein
MAIKQPAFYRTNEEKQDIVPVRFNEEERRILNEAKKFLEQPKDATCLKSLMRISYANVIHDKKTNILISTLFKNRANNKRTGNQFF